MSNRIEFPTSTDGGIVLEHLERDGVQTVRLAIVVGGQSNRISLLPGDAVQVAMKIVELAQQAVDAAPPEHYKPLPSGEVLN